MIQILFPYFWKLTLNRTFFPVFFDCFTLKDPETNFFRIHSYRYTVYLLAQTFYLRLHGLSTGLARKSFGHPEKVKEKCMSWFKKGSTQGHSGSKGQKNLEKGPRQGHPPKLE